jgi:uncharacterized protein with HEPN domain
MLEACRRIRRYAVGMDQAELLAATMAYGAVLRNLEVLGEAAKRIPPEVRQQLPSVEWARIAGMRDWLAPRIFR